MRKLLLLSILCFPYVIACSQSGALDLSFNVGAGANGIVYTTSIQSDGKILIGGIFSSYNNSPMSCIARLNMNGALDTSFNPGTGATISPDTNGVPPVIFASAIQNDGRFIVGGYFNSYNGIAVSNLVRINTDGTPDTTFYIVNELIGNVFAIAIQSDGKIVVGGLFNILSGSTQKNLARFNTDGSLDTTFDSGLSPNGSVQAIAIQGNGKIVVAGNFTEYGNTYTERITRVNTDGTLDATFNPGFSLGADKVIYSLALEDNDQYILIGGCFTTYQLQARGGVARLNTNGSLESMFSPDGGANAGCQINSILVQSNGNILIAGKFYSFNNTSVSDIALLTTYGVLDTATFNPGSGPNNDIFCTARQTDGKIIIGGTFTTYDSIPRARVARLYNCILPQPGPITGDSTTLCGGTSTYSISPVAGADNYTWTLPPGWTGSSDSTSIIATSDGSGGIISVTANSSLCGVSAAQTDSITEILPPGIPICLCTVDTPSTHNIVVWDKPQTALIDSFFIYRLITTNSYSKIAAVPYDSLSEYNDYAANPNVTSYTYKLSTLDNCGVESPLSLYHSTINLQNLGSGNFQWTFYEIENSPNPVISFNVYRDDLGNGNFSQIGFVPGTNATFTDVTYSSFPNAIYVVDVQWDISCNPTRAISTTRSNIRNGKKSLEAIDENLFTGNLEIYPNPAAKEVNLLLPSSLVVTGLKLVNALGQLVWKEVEPENSTGGLRQVDIENFSPGLYMLTVETDEGTINRKLIIR